MRLPRGVCSGLSDALERFEEDEWLGSSGSEKRIAYVRHFANYAACIQLSVLSVQSPGEPGLFYFNRFSLQVSVQGGDFERVIS